ncbi:RNA methyltransferase [Kaistella haifensis DSM 19056]|uniref:RNA methyltransferase n=1 Tax=Kaistella haifensis DSM 19056 TaxID=1450526 RepID=A0A246BAY0_9FLAO|nr:RNA methyltransferase [Kaistella haifensis]OWK98843.1 RNA methyltransferase [Kaistella haifensis DSM 19056]
MLTAHKIKILQSLYKKKFRQKYNLFLVEGNKTIKEIPLSRYKIQEIFTVNPSELGIDGVKIIEISDSELKKISFLQHPKDSVAVCELLEPKFLADVPIQLVLDGIQDPGNLGTIIRLADWFGIEQIICSEDTVDFYNPKVIQASMGSFLRVNINYQNIENYLQNSTAAIIGTDMDGENFYQFDFPEKFNLILGNEGNGIRPNIEELLTHKITIPRFGKSKSTESLNVSMAAGIILGQIFSEK